MSVQKISFKSTNLLPQQTNIQVKTNEQSVANKPAANKKLAYVSAVVALASLGVTGVVAFKHGKLSKQLKSAVKEN